MTAALALLTARPSVGYRREYRVTLAGQRKPSSEVCIYRGSGANAFSMFFSDPEPKCLPAEKVLDFPPGFFNVYARHHDGYISSFRDFTSFPDPPQPEKGYELLDIPLEPAGYVDFSDVVRSLPIGDAVGVWLAPDPERVSTYFPLVPGETVVMVPADRIVVPLHLRGRVPIAVGEAVSVRSGEHVKANLSVPGHTLVAWVIYDRKAAATAEQLMPPPDVLLSTHGQILRPIVPLFDANATGTLMFFRNVPVGPAEVFVQGMMWQTSRVPAVVDESSAALVMAPVRLAAAGAVRVDMSREQKQDSTEPCDTEEGRDVPRLSAQLLRCPTPAGNCEAAQSIGRISRFSDHVQIEGLEAGTYQVVMRPPLGKAASVDVGVHTGRLSVATVSFPSAIRFFGTVTINGEPTAARLLFATGEARSGEAGEYTAELPADPLSNLIRVIPCSSQRELRFIPKIRIQANGWYDIALNVRPISVHVVDSHDADIADAEIWYGVVKESALPIDASQSPTLWFSSTRQRSDAQGNVRFEDVPLRATDTVLLCAHHEGYDTPCVKGPHLDERDAAVTITLTALGVHGKVLDHQGAGFLAFVAPTGVISEQATIAADGTFALKTRHQQPEYIVYVSQARPLTVMAIPADWGGERDELELAIAPAASRSFTASVDRNDQSGYLGVWVGPAYVPLEILAIHQDFHGHDVRIEKGKSLRVADIAETAPISVAFAPDMNIPQSPIFVDPFTLPQFGGVRRTAVGSEQIVLNSR